MGLVRDIGFGRIPEQGRDKGRTVRACFEYDLARTVHGVVIQDDTEFPGRTIIQRDDGRVVLASECQFQVLHDWSGQSDLRPSR